MPLGGRRCHLPPYKNQRALRASLAAYARDAVEEVRSAVEQSESLPTLTYHRFEFHLPHGMNGLHEPRPNWFVVLRRLSSRIEALPSYAKARDALAAQPRIRSRRPVGHGIMTTPLRSEQVLFDLPCAVLGYHTSARLDETRLEAACDRLLELLSGTADAIIATAPLIDFDSDLESLELSEHLRIDRLSEDELHRLGRDWWSGALAFSEFGAVIPRYAMRYRWGESEGVGQYSAVLTHRSQDEPPRTHTRRLLQALRLFQRGSVSMPLLLFRHHPWHPERLGQSAHLLGTGTPLGGEAYSLPAGLTKQFQAFWQELGREFPLLSPRGELSLRRFGLALERRLPEDSIVDFAIAIEAAMRRDPIERSPKLAKRAAALVSEHEQHDQELENQCLEIFQMRNRLLHEGVGQIRAALAKDDTVSDVLVRAADTTRIILRSAFLRGELRALHAGREAGR